MSRLSNCVRPLFALTVVAACALTAAAQGPQKSDPQTQDEAAIRENVRKMEEGWNTKNATLFAEPYAEDGDGVAIGGFVGKGRELIEKVHWGMFKGDFKDSTIALKVRQLRFLRPDVALVQIDNTNTFRQGSQVKHEYKSVITLVMTKEAGRWKIASFQNTIAEPPSWRRQQ
ncbi:MAG TPA: SgcJ/EcaC family oxidoreductase [Pyrinomonadaceae bacterium]|nr:SgcJ/EcaC family oxidoreductase [Pyrinomonadaceae bacterium]